MPPEQVIPPELIEELSASGAICEKCGGVHNPPGPKGMDQLISAFHAEKQGGFKVPWCTCPACPVCQDPQGEATVRGILLARTRKKENTP